jgi:signal peptidase I
MSTDSFSGRGSKHWIDLGLSAVRYVNAVAGGLMLLLLVLVVVNSFALTYYRVDGLSMYPTLKNGELLAVNLLAFERQPPKDGQIVIVRYAGDSQITFVKRIVAGPGETVEFHGAPLQLGPSQYFVEGDNRTHSTDSRTFGPIDRDQVIGAVLPLRLVS